MGPVLFCLSTVPEWFRNARRFWNGSGATKGDRTSPPLRSAMALDVLVQRSTCPGTHPGLPVIDGHVLGARALLTLVRN